MGEILESDSIDLYVAFLTDFRGYHPTDLPLSSEEQKRGNTIVSPQRREEYLLTRLILRNLLGRYLDILPREIPLCLTRRGKPYMPKNFFSPTPHLFFSISHSAGMVLFSFSSGLRSGVDLEKKRQVRNMNEMVSYVFPGEEQDLWKSRSLKERKIYFFQTWTRREAVIKCLGLSAAEAIHSFLIQEIPWENRDAKEKSWQAEGCETAITGRDLNLPWNGYAAAAWEGEVRKILLFRATPDPNTTDRLLREFLREIVLE